MDSPLVFVSYSHADEKWEKRLLPHLKALRLEVWDDRQIHPGTDWFPRIQEVIDQAAVSICLLSPDYLASTFCQNHEIPYLIDQQKKNGMHALPPAKSQSQFASPSVWSRAPVKEFTGS